MVALYSVITAGPEYFFPAGSASRERIAADNFLPEKNTAAESFNTFPGFARLGRAGAPVPTWPRACWDLIVARKRKVTSSTSRVG